MSSLRNIKDLKNISPDLTTTLASYIFGYDIKAIIDPCENKIFGEEIEYGTKRLQPFDSEAIYYFGDIISIYSTNTNTYKLYQCTSKEENGISGAFNVVNWREYSLYQLIEDYTSFTCNKPLPADIGGYKQNHIFNKEPIVKVLYNILYYSIKPEVTIKNEEIQDIYCCIGTEVLNKTITFELNKRGHEDISEVKLLKVLPDGSSSIIEIWDDEISETLETTIPTIDDNCSIKVEINMGGAKLTYTLLNYYFSYPVYGIFYIAEGETNDIDTMNLNTDSLYGYNDISPIPSMNVRFSSYLLYNDIPKRMCLLFPEGWLGQPSSSEGDKFIIKDQDGNIITDTFNKKQITLTINNVEKKYDGYFTDLIVSSVKGKMSVKMIEHNIIFKDKLNDTPKEVIYKLLK